MIKNRLSLFVISTIVLFLNLNILCAMPPGSAKVIESSEQAMKYALIAISTEQNNNLGEEESLPLITIESDSCGVFLFPHLPDGRYYIDIASFGYNPYTASFIVKKSENPLVGRTFTLYKIIEAEIDEIIVRYRKPQLYREGNKFVIPNISSSAFAQGQSVLNLMRFLPLVRITGENEVKLPGNKDAVIYINDRPSMMTSDALQSYLQGIPASNLDKVEIIISPGSRYNASHEGGVINIVMKKRPDEGLKTTISSNAFVTNSRFGGGVSTYFDYSKNRWRINSGLNGKIWEYESSSEEHQFLPLESRNVFTDTFMKNKSRSYGTFVNIDYDISDKHIIGARVNANGFDYKRNNELNADYWTDGSQVDSTSTGIFKTHNPNPAWVVSANINYTYLTDIKGSKFNADIYRIDRWSKTNDANIYTTLNNISQGQTILTNYRQNDRLDNSAYAAKFSYNQIFNEKSHLDFGIDINYGEIKSRYIHEIFDDGNYIDDPLKSNYFGYSEYLVGGYVVYGTKWSNDLETEIGLRYEWDRTKGDQKTIREKTTRTFSDLFPSFSVNWNPHTDHEFSLDFTSGIRRPTYTNYNTFKRFISPNSYRQGNIYLSPVKTYNLDFSYTFFDDYTLLVEYSHTKDATANFSLPDKDGYIRHSYYNYGQSNTVDFIFELWKTFANNRFTLIIEVDACFDSSTGRIDSDNVDYDDWSLDFSLKLNTVISKKYKISSNITYDYWDGGQSASCNIPERHFLSFDITKVFKNASLGLYMRNLQLPVKTKTNEIRRDFERYYWSKLYPTFSISYHHTFGNNATKKIRQRPTNNMESRFE